MLRIERHRRLESQDGEEQDHAGKVEDEEGYGIVEPVLFIRGSIPASRKKARSKNLRNLFDAHWPVKIQAM
jgi:hypothetical protein